MKYKNDRKLIKSDVDISPEKRRKKKIKNQRHSLEI